MYGVDFLAERHSEACAGRKIKSQEGEAKVGKKDGRTALWRWDRFPFFGGGAYV